MSEPMSLETALAIVEDVAVDKRDVGATRAAEALALVAHVARENHFAKVVAATNAATARAQRVLGPVVEPATGHVLTVHFFRGPSGGTCYLCPHPKDHDIHQNRGAP